MSKKLFLTGVFVACTFVPVYAGADYITNESTCSNGTLGSTSGASLIAEWTPQQYTVTYNCGSGTGTAPGNGTATYGENYTFAANGANNCSKEGYTFNGWSCSDTLGNRAASSVYQWAITPSSAVSCTAQWNANTINLDWNPDNGQAHIQNTCIYDGMITLPPEPTKVGYNFAGWIVVPQSNNE